MSSKVIEAQEHCRTAEKFLKTSLFRWKPDLDSAAHEYTQAAQCYRIARHPANCKENHLKAAECYLRNSAFFHAGRAMENAILASKEITPPDELYRLAMESSNLYQQHGSGDAAANVLDKTAKILEVNSPELAVELYQQAANASSIESGQHQGAEYMGKATRLFIRLQWYPQAVGSIRREIGFHQEAGNTGAIGRLTMGIVLVYLAIGDTVAAEKAYREWGANCEAPEVQTIENLIGAYDENDRDGAVKALASPFIRNMDVEFSRLALNIPLPQGLQPDSGANARPIVADPYVPHNQGLPLAPAPDVVEPHQPEDEGGLC